MGNAKTKKIIEVHSPPDGRKIGEVPSFSVDEALTCLKEVYAAQARWKQVSISDRLNIMKNFARILHKNAEEVAKLLSMETGKPLYEAYVHEILPIIHLTAYFVKRAEKILNPKPIPIWIFKNRKSYIHYTPRGVSFIISPWNFPFSIPAGVTIMNLIAGNGVLLKPASLTPLIAYKMREMFNEAGLDPGLFQVISGPGKMAEELIEKGASCIGFVNFTGSTAIGKVVASVCGKHLIPCSMELGGKDPAIICEDADIALAAKSVVLGAFGNSGQICASVERVYAHKNIFDAFVTEVTRLTKHLRQDHPLKNSSADMGAMTSQEQIHIVEKQLEDAIKKGANILTGGKRSDKGAMYFEPTIITNITDDMEIICEETFGPLLPIIKVDDENEAIRRANDSIYGLNAYVFTKNTKKGKKVAEQLVAGTVMINETLLTQALPDTPWQGFKASGIGRVHSDEGLKDLCLASHVNYNTMSLPKPLWNNFWLWHPYNREKFSQFHSFYGLLFVSYSIGEKITLFKNMLLRKPKS